MTELNTKNQTGMTLIELVLVIVVFSILSGLIVINLLSVRHKTSLTSSVSILLTDLKSQQLKAMTGDTEGRAASDVYGVYFEVNRYTLFHGASFDPSDTANFPVELEDSLAFENILFPNSSIIFSQGSGEVVGFSESTNTVTIKNTLSGEDKTITVNRYGAVEVD